MHDPYGSVAEQTPKHGYRGDAAPEPGIAGPAG